MTLHSHQLQLDPRWASKTWRMSHLYGIVDKETSHVIPFSRNLAQRKLTRYRHNRRLILKGRQLGITTDRCVDFLDEVLFNKHRTAVIIAHERDALKTIFRKVQRAWNYAQPFVADYPFFRHTINSNENELRFDNGSSIHVALSSRSDTVNYLLVSELAKMFAKYPEKADEVIRGAFESVPLGQQIDIECTSEGRRDRYYDMYSKAVSKPPTSPNDFQAVFLPWHEFPQYQMDYFEQLPERMLEYQRKYNLTDRQINWYYSKFKVLGADMLREYPTTWIEAFEAPIDGIFDTMKINDRLVELGSCPTPIRLGLWRYFNGFTGYDPNHFYAIGIDVSSGYGLDSSVICIIDLTTNEQVAEWVSNRVTPGDLADIVVKETKEMKHFIIAPERNSMGAVVVEDLKKLNMGSYMYREKDFEMINNKPKFKYGWVTTKSSKQKILMGLKTDFENGDLKLFSSPLLREMRNFDTANLLATSQEQINFTSNVGLNIPDEDEMTKHYDRMMAVAIAWEMKGCELFANVFFDRV